MADWYLYLQAHNRRLTDSARHGLHKHDSTLTTSHVRQQGAIMWARSQTRLQFVTFIAVSLQPRQGAHAKNSEPQDKHRGRKAWTSTTCKQ